MSGQYVGVVGDERLVEAVEAAGARAIVDGDLDSVDLVVANGEAALVDVARRGIDAPVLPVDAASGFRSVTNDGLETALERIFREHPGTERHPIVEATGTFDPVRALFDVALVTAEPARISEFAVQSGDDRVGQFRADGVVVSTPAGSRGYNRNAGGPIVASGTDVVSVVPIAPFATTANHWVLPIDGVTISVERDETPVELLLDGRRERFIESGEPITVSRIDHLETYESPESDGSL